MNHVELSFPVFGQAIPKDHAYTLYSAISKILDNHLPQGIAISPIRDRSLWPGRTESARERCLRIRTPVESIGQLLPLAGKFLGIEGAEIGLGTPRIHALQPCTTLKAHVVTIKGFIEPQAFLDAVGRQLKSLEISGEASIPIIETGARKGEPRRRILRIKNKIIIGYCVVVANLSDADSYRLLAVGLGGRRHMGCGIFVPVKDEGDQP